MTRFDDSASCERRRSLRSTLSDASLGRFRALTLAVLLCVAQQSSSPAADVYSSSLNGAANAAARSQYMQSQRQQTAAQAQYQQAATEAQYQRQFLLQQQEQQRRQAQAAYAQQQARQQAQATSSQPKNFLSGLFGDRPSSQPQNQQSQQRQSFAQTLQAPFQRSESQAQPRQSFVQSIQAPFQRSDAPQQGNEPERNGVFGLSPLFKRSSQPQQSYASSRAPSASQSYAQPTRGMEYAAPNRTNVPSAEALAQASTDRNEARDVLARIPWDSLHPTAKQKIQQLTSSPTLYRRLPMAGGRCNPELFDFFLTHPNAVVELWHSMGYKDVTMVAEGNGIYSLRESSGSEGKVQVLYQDSELTLAYCYGSYKGLAIGRPLSGEVFLVLQTRYTEDVDLTPLVVCRLDAFIEIKNPGVDLLARTFSSAIGKIADANFEQTLAFVDSVSRTIESNPREFQQIAFSLSGLAPEARRVLAQKAERVGEQARMRRAGQMVEYELLAKMNQPSGVYARILSREHSGHASGAPIASRRPNASGAPSPIAPPSLNAGSSVARNSSLGTTTAFAKSSVLSSNDFSLADDSEDFESSLEWDDDEDESIVNVYRSGVATPGGSLAKISAKPSTNSSALGLLEEQERRLAPSYVANGSATLSTDDEEEFALGEEDTLGEEEFVLEETPALVFDDENGAALSTDDEEEFALEENDALSEEESLGEELLLDEDYSEEESLVAIPSALTSNSSDERSKPSALVADDAEPAIAASALTADDAETNDELLLEEPIILELPSEKEIATVLTADDEEETIAAEEETLIASDDENSDASLDASAPALVATDDEFELAAQNPRVVEEEEEEALDASEDASEIDVDNNKTAPVAKPVDVNDASGWVPVLSAKPAPAKKQTQVVAKTESALSQTTKQNEWSAVGRDAPASSLPTKFVTRRFSRPVQTEETLGAAEPSRTIDSYASQWKEPEKTAVAIESPSFKKPIR